MKKHNGVNYSRSVYVTARRKGALVFLEKQLESGVKNTNDGPVALTEKDTVRINREIATLKTRISNERV